MDKYTKLTLEELMRRKEQIMAAKKVKKTQTLYIESLDGTIVIEEPDRECINDAVGMGDEGNEYLVYNCVIEPKLKSSELLKEFGCIEPSDIVGCLFNAGEIAQIATQCMEIAGYKEGSVKAVNAIKNS